MRARRRRFNDILVFMRITVYSKETKQKTTMNAVWWRWQYYPTRLQIKLINGNIREFNAFNIWYIDAEKGSLNYYENDGNGYVYILSNPAIPGLLKVGYTRKDPEDRVAALSNHTNMPLPFVIEAVFLCSDPQWDEIKAHHALDSCRIGDKEFFALSIKDAIEIVKKSIKE